MYKTHHVVHKKNTHDFIKRRQKMFHVPLFPMIVNKSLSKIFQSMKIFSLTINFKFINIRLPFGLMVKKSISIKDFLLT